MSRGHSSWSLMRIKESRHRSHLRNLGTVISKNRSRFHSLSNISDGAWTKTHRLYPVDTSNRKGLSIFFFDESCRATGVIRATSQFSPVNFHYPPTTAFEESLESIKVIGFSFCAHAVFVYLEGHRESEECQIKF